MLLDFSPAYRVFFQLSDDVIEKWLVFVLPQGIFVPSFISIACSNQKLGRGKSENAGDRQVIGLSPNNSILTQSVAVYSKVIKFQLERVSFENF